MSKNELVQKSYKGVFCRRLVLYTDPRREGGGGRGVTTDKFSHFVGLIMTAAYRGLCVAT